MRGGGVARGDLLLFLLESGSEGVDALLDLPTGLTENPEAVAEDGHPDNGADVQDERDGLGGGGRNPEKG